MNKLLRKMKSLKSIVAIGAAICCSASAWAAEFTDGNGLKWTYTASSGKATLSNVAKADGSALTGTLTIPATINGATVTAIGVNAFQNLGITNVQFPEGITTIEDGAFLGCTALESLTLPDSLTKIGGGYYSSSKGGAFADCTALKSVKLGNGLVTIGDGRTGGNTLSPDTYASSGVFGNCGNLETVEFGSNLKTIGHHAFSECIALKSLTIPDSVQTIGGNAFYHNTGLTSVSFGVGLVTIDECAFYNCSALQSIEFKQYDTPLLTIKANVFANAVKLTHLSFSESLKEIADGAFLGCISLESLILPDSLTKIGGGYYSSSKGGAFADCTVLKSVKLGNGLVTIGDGRTGGDTLSPDTHASSGVFGNCGNLETVEFGPNLETIGHHAFSECGHLKSLTIPDSVTTIGENCFYNNIRLTTVTFGADLQSIGECAFMGCVSLSSVSFSPATTPLLTINANAFRNCLCLASLTLSNAMPTIKSGAFEGCTMLRRITVPSLMSTIESNVFSGMENLNEIIFLGLPPENLANAGLATDIKLRYPKEYKDDWEAVIKTIGFTNTSEFDSGDLGGIVGDSRYGLSDKPSDRAIASITVNQNNSPLNEIVMEEGKVFDCIIRIVNTAANDVTVTLPAGYVYESFKNATPLVIPANSRNILTITRTSETTFLVTREELSVLQQ